MAPTVHIVGGDRMYRAMFQRRGWIVVDNISEAALVQFTGGEDVTPKMYGELPHPTTGYNPHRDAYEAAVFAYCQNMKVPVAGICRGGQFLNVMSGGWMWQDVDRHAIDGNHEATDTLTNATVMVSSTHHQMMRPSIKADILLWCKRSTRKERMGTSGVCTVFSDGPDVEACFYAETQALCFQPHPEFPRPDLDTCRQVYFNYIEEYLGIKGGSKVCVDSSE